VGADVLEAMASHLLGQSVFLMEGVDGTVLRSLLREKALPGGPLTMKVATAVMKKLGVRRSAHQFRARGSVGAGAGAAAGGVQHMSPVPSESASPTTSEEALRTAVVCAPASFAFSALGVGAAGAWTLRRVVRFAVRVRLLEFAAFALHLRAVDVGVRRPPPPPPLLPQRGRPWHERRSRGGSSVGKGGGRGRPRTPKPPQVSRTFPIPCSSVGKVIGSGGSTISGLRHTHRVYISVADALDGDTSTVTVLGNDTASVDAASAAVLKLAVPLVEREVRILREDKGWVIGPAGAAIHRLQSKHGVRVLFPDPSIGERQEYLTMIVTGNSSADVQACVNDIKRIAPHAEVSCYWALSYASVGRGGAWWICVLTITTSPLCSHSPMRNCLPSCACFLC
jgi:hypothetical protein